MSVAWLDRVIIGVAREGMIIDQGRTVKCMATKAAAISWPFQSTPWD